MVSAKENDGFHRNNGLREVKERDNDLLGLVYSVFIFSLFQTVN